MSDLIDNETVKLMANWLNGMSIALVGTGIIIPVVNQLVGNVPLSSESLSLLVIGCLVFAVVLHFLGHKVLRGLHEPDKQ